MRVVLAGVPLVAAGRFNCTPVVDVPAPKDITDLHPSHVSVVMAVGDSITAAFSARSDLNEARDISWSIGQGTEDQLTFPWLVSQYSSKVEGQSTKAVLPNDVFDLPHGDYHKKTDNLNVAESEGAAHRGSLDEQWAYLEDNFGKYEDFDSRWKVLTVWMMANDVCGDCNSPTEEGKTFPVWEQKMEEFLENATARLKNTYINVISTLDLSNIARIQRSKLGCTIEHKYIVKECGCIDKGNSTQLAMLDRNVHYYNDRLHKFASDWYAKLQQQGRTDIAIVTQSFMEQIGPTLDFRFLSKLDCFHPSASAHEDLAIGLWNSMLCTDNRQGRCGMHFSPDIPVTCPTKDSRFYTGPDVVPGPPPMGILV